MESFWMTLFYILFFILLLLIIFYHYGTRTYDHFHNTSIKHIKPQLPFLGSGVEVLFQKEHMIDFYSKHYKSHLNEKYIGMFTAQIPAILLIDLQLIKETVIKNFDHFPSHEIIVNSELDPLFGNSLISLTGEKWKNMRSTLSPAFTSSKMKTMFVLVEDCAKRFAEFYIHKIESSGNEIFEIEAKDSFTRYTNDVISNAVFGVDIDSLKNENNDFYRLTKLATTFSSLETLKYVGYSFIPSIMKALKIEFINKEAKCFFKEVVSSTFNYREKNNIIRNDMLHLLMEARKGSLKSEKNDDELNDFGFAVAQDTQIETNNTSKKWNDDELVAQAFLFVLAGFETTSVLISFFFYEMVRNVDIQKRLQQEIDDLLLQSNNKPSYKDILGMKYLDNCISETLRLWPPASVMDRVCKKPYVLPPPNDFSIKQYKMNVNEVIWIPIYAIHHDERYYHNSEIFDPDRFSDENRASFVPEAYMPFGIGPRNCIGSRFALMVSKVIAFHLLAKFDFVIVPKTQIPVVLDKNCFNLVPKDGMYVGLRKRIS